MKRRILLMAFALLMDALILWNKPCGSAADEKYAKAASSSTESVSPQGQAKIQFEKTVENYGVAQEGEKVTRRFSFTNTGTGDLLIERLQPTCGCTAAAGSTNPVRPGESGYIDLTYDSRGKIGHAFKDVKVITNASSSPVMIALEGTIAASMHPTTRPGDFLFKGSCAECHAIPAKGKEGKELYDAVCSMCHDMAAGSKKVVGHSRENMALMPEADLKKMIFKGIPGTSMPGFGSRAGGPLSKKQIKSLLNYLESIKPK